MVYKVKVGSGGTKGSEAGGSDPQGGIATLFGPSTLSGLNFNSSTFGFYPKPAWDPNGSGTVTNSSGQTGWYSYIRAGGGNGGYNSNPILYPTGINYGGNGGASNNSTSSTGPMISGTTHLELNGSKGDDGKIVCATFPDPIGGLNGQVSASVGRGGNATPCAVPASITPTNGQNGQIVISW